MMQKGERRMIKYNRVLFKKLWCQGLLMKDLAEQFRCTQQTIYNIARKEKIFPYNEGER